MQLKVKIVVTDDKCSPVTGVDANSDGYNDGDTDTDGLLDVTETWIYECTITIPSFDSLAGAPLVNTGTVNGEDIDGDPLAPDDDTHSITVVPRSAVTDSATPHCEFDVDDDLSNGRQFRLLFTPDLKNWPAYKLTASNPGQYFYNVFDGKDPLLYDTTTLFIEIPYPFVVQGAMAIHIYHGVSPSVQNGLHCFLPEDEFEARPAEIIWGPEAAYGDTQILTLTDVPLSDDGFVYVNIHLDYGLKGTTGYGRNSIDDAVDFETGLIILVPNEATYTFSYHNGTTDSDTVESVNEFKKIPGVAGFVYDRATGITLVDGALVKLTILDGVNPKYEPRVLTAITDEDGWYMIEYKHKGKPADYIIEVWENGTGEGLADYTETVRLKGNAFAEATFMPPPPP
jgi:hypothetical protein